MNEIAKNSLKPGIELPVVGIEDTSDDIECSKYKKMILAYLDLRFHLLWVIIFPTLLRTKLWVSLQLIEVMLQRMIHESHSSQRR